MAPVGAAIRGILNYFHLVHWILNLHRLALGRVKLVDGEEGGALQDDIELILQQVHPEAHLLSGRAKISFHIRYILLIFMQVHKDVLVVGGHGKVFGGGDYGAGEEEGGAGQNYGSLLQYLHDIIIIF